MLHRIIRAGFTVEGLGFGRFRLWGLGFRV